tara:strand:+ start:13999 stop:14589 length:591 start_codon:yes stop_codon:yes gene_type:complete
MNDPENQNPEDYPKMRIAQMPLKKSFKVVLDTNNTASYSGSQFDARFTVDLNQIIREPWRMKKSYLMTFSFRSISATFAVSGVTSTKLYKLHIDIGKGTPTIFQYNATRAPAGIVGVSNDGVGVYTNVAAASAFDIPCYFNARPADNDGVFVNDLLGINGINLNLIDPTTGTFNSADNATINTNTKYICVLNFQEL